MENEKIIPIKIMANRIIKATSIELLAIRTSDVKEIVPDTRIVTKKMVTTHRIVLFRSFLAEFASDLDTSPVSFIENDKTVAGRINLTA